MLNSTAFDQNTTVIQGDYERCTRVIRRIMNLPGFQLLDEAEFIRLAYNRVQGKNEPYPDRAYQNTAINIYSECLYAAATSREDPAIQERGFQELSRYLYRMAYNFYLHQSLSAEEGIDKAQDCTQLALERIYAHISNVKTPGSFLKWCGVILRNVCLEEARSRKMDISLDQTENENLIQVINDLSGLDASCVYQCLSQAVTRLKQEYQQVIQLTYFAAAENGEKRSDDEIAALLEVRIGNLYTLRSRALASLKRDEQLSRCLQELL